MAESEKEVVITYETLFELLRLEKSRPDLQKINPTFYADALVYLNEKLSILQEDKSQTSLFASAEKEKTRRELENIGRILKELYDRREKKIMDISMIKSRTDSSIIDTSNMLESEKELFETITNDLALYRSAGLLKLLNGQEPKSVLQQATQEVNKEEKKTEEAETAPTEPKNPNIYKEEIASPVQQAQNNRHNIKFVAAVDEIVGPDLQIYGPFESGTTAELPKELAQALVNNKQAERM
ncbi:hypothetical protein ACFL96_09090 [Thermoproteota archaeon]